MNLTDIGDLTVRMARHRLRVSVAARTDAGMYCDMYVDGRPMISIWGQAGGNQRQMIEAMAENLGPGSVAITHDAYYRTAVNPDLNMAAGTLAAAFESGDPDVSEAITVAAASNDEAPVTIAIPYKRDGDTGITFSDSIDSTGEVSGRVPDEIVAMLNGKFDGALADMIYRHSDQIPHTAIHLYDGGPWDGYARDPGFDQRWTRTSSGLISAQYADPVAVSLLDVTLTDADRAQIQNALGYL